MPVVNEGQVTVAMFREMLDNMSAQDDDVIYIHGEFGKMGIYTMRRMEVTEDSGDEGENFILING